MKKFIEFINVSKEYGTGENVFKSLNKIDFTIGEGEFVVILGPSGAGKTTLLNLLGGLDIVSEGQIIVDGENIEKYDDNKLTKYRGENIGFVFQFYNLIPTLTALENVELIKDIVKYPINSNKVLKMVDLNEHGDQFPSQLSGGEQQRVSIGRAIAKKPKILLCDEPTGALDSGTGFKILKLLQNINKKHNTTLVIVTHNSLLSEVADKVLKIKNGEIEDILLNESPKLMDEIDW